MRWDPPKPHVFAALGVVYNDGWAKGGVVGAVIIAILLYWSITKERKSLTPISHQATKTRSSHLISVKSAERLA